MNDWKDVPHLFANEKFFVKLKKNDKIYNRRIDGYTNRLEDRFVDFPHTGCFHISDGSRYLVEDCTLIARKIEDMTEAEFEKWNEIHDTFYTDEFYYPNPEAFIFLLNKGVYPFDQSDFGKTVIDIKTL